jgi:hypothetical protein
MRHIDRINKQYEEKEVKLLYDKAVALMNLLSDEEYEQVITDNADIFKLASHPERGEFYLQDKSNLIRINEIFTNFIVSKGLSRDEFNSMTTDEIKEYILDVVSSLDEYKPDELFQLIKNLEKLA